MILRWLAKLFDSLLFCPHKRLTFPITRKGRHTYSVCLDCGKEMPYDWRAMKAGKERKEGTC
jgi:hypothetical protein